MLFVEIYFIMEIVIDGESQAGNPVDLLHLLDESRTMSTLALTGSWIHLEEIGVDHLMEQCFFYFIRVAEFQQRFRERNGGRSESLVFACASASSHLLGPSDCALLKLILEEK